MPQSPVPVTISTWDAASRLGVRLRHQQAGVHALQYNPYPALIDVRRYPLLVTAARLIAEPLSVRAQRQNFLEQARNERRNA